MPRSSKSRLKKRPPSPSLHDPRLRQRFRNSSGFTGVKAEFEELETSHSPAFAVPVAEDAFPASKKRRASPSLLSPRPNRRLKYSGATIEITVGTASVETFSVHAEQLKQHSKLLSAAFENEQIEDSMKTFTLPNVEPDVFRLYMEWLYDGTISIRAKDISEMTYSDHAAEWTVMSNLYLLAISFQDHDCCDTIMEAMIEKIEEKDEQGRQWYPADHNIKTLYHESTKGSPVQEFLLEAYLRAPGGAASLISHDNEMNHVGFLADLTRVLLAQREAKPSEELLSSQKRRFLYSGRTG